MLNAPSGIAISTSPYRETGAGAGRGAGAAAGAGAGGAAGTGGAGATTGRGGTTGTGGAAGTGGTGGTPPPADNAQYNFESGTQGWSVSVI